MNTWGEVPQFITLHCRSFVFELYRVFLNVHAVILHKRKHLKGETFVMVWVFKSGGVIHWHHFGQVIVITVGTPGAREKLEPSGRTLHDQAVKTRYPFMRSSHCGKL